MAGVSVSALWARDGDLAAKVEAQEHQRRHARGMRLLMLTLSTLGVVYGDIGTSPLYTYGAIFPDGAQIYDKNAILGTASTIFWTLTAIVLVKYVMFTMQADDNGEGGIFALYALICRAANIRSGARLTEADLSLEQYQAGRPANTSRVAAALRRKLESSRVLQVVLLIVVLLASNMIISDGVLTPAISVVGAIEGIKFQTNISTGTVVGISMGILVVLFALQSGGTERVSCLFSPVTLLWFVANAMLGIYNISRFGAGVFRALSPHYMYYFWSGNAAAAWRNLGNIMLCVTGAEALYADMGHFNALSIRLSFIFIVYPSLTLTYLGQTAMLLQRPEAASAAYWESIPNSLLWPMVVLATLAAIIASQALITGSFSIVQQAMAMNAFPRLTIRHTSKHIMGQVYIPEVNYLLLLGTLAVVGVFQTSSKIGNAYGLAVITVMLLDTTLFTIVAVAAWEWHPLAAGTFWAVFSFITGAFLSSNVSKVPKGAWFSLALSAALSCITFLWHWGQQRKLDYIRKNKILLRDMYREATAVPATNFNSGAGKGVSRGLLRPSAHSAVRSSDGGAGPAVEHPQVLQLAGTHLPVARVPGIGIYYNELLLGVPPVLERFMSLVPAIHEVVIFLTVRVVPVPYVLPQERLLLRRLRFAGFYHVVARYGYLDEIRHNLDFIDSVVEEIHEYLEPATGVMDLSAEAAETAAAAGAGGIKPSEDVEKGLAHGEAAHGEAWPASQEGSVRRRRVVHVDGAESLTAVSGHQLRERLAVQLVDLGRRSTPLARTSAGAGGDAAGMSVPISGGGSACGVGGPADLTRTSTITMAVPVMEEDKSAHGGKESGQPTAPWVQMPSQLRRVRARLLGLAESEEESVVDAQHSLPLPAARQRPPLPRILTADSTKSLPLPQTSQQGRRVPLYRLQHTMAAAAAAGMVAAESAPGLAVGTGMQRVSEMTQPPMSPPLPTPTSTLTPAAAARLGQQLWQQLQQGRLQRRLTRISADSRAAGGVGAAVGEAAQHVAPLSLRSDNLSEHQSQQGGRAETVCTEDMLAASAAVRTMDAEAARRQLFQMQAHPGVTGADRFEAERLLLLSARARGVTFLLGRSSLRAEPGSSWLKTLLLETAYGLLVAVSRPTTRTYQIPREHLLSVGIDFEI